MEIKITFDPDLPLNEKIIGHIIENHLSHLPFPIDVTVTPGAVDFHKGKTFSDIEVGGDLYKQLKKIAKERDIPIEQVLRRGMDKLKLKGEI